MFDSITNAVVLFGGLYGLLVAAGLLVRREHSVYDNTVAGLYAAIGIWLLYSALHYMGFPHEYPNLLMSHAPATYLVGPFLYFYFHLLAGEEELPDRAATHFLPSLCAFLVLLPGYVLVGESGRFCMAHLARNVLQLFNAQFYWQNPYCRYEGYHPYIPLAAMQRL